MFKVLHFKEVLGGSLKYQADVQERLVKTFEQKLNDLNVVSIHSLSFYKEDGEFGLVSVVEIVKSDKKSGKK
jgi:hypothetical protein